MKVVSNLHIDNACLDWPLHMSRAVELAQNVLNTHPNPRVGCVIVRDGNVLGEGWHSFPGQGHAEVMALESAKLNSSDVAGSTVFVSLEPCAHQGRTGPCAEALVAEKVATVVIASLDPNPKVCGRGIAILESANIDVIHLIDFELAARAINPGFHKRFESSLPYVRVKLAASLDGRTALSNGLSKWITGMVARADVQQLRARSSAIVTGIGTILADDPLLNVRATELNLTEAAIEANKLSLTRQPLRVVVDSSLQIPYTAKIFGSGPVAVFTCASDAEISQLKSTLPDSAQIEIIQCPQEGKSAEAGVNLRFVLESLAQMECNEILVEAGPTLCSAFISENLLDELIVYIAPKLMGSDSKPLLNLTGICDMDATVDFDIQSLDKIGGDIKVTLVPKP